MPGIPTVMSPPQKSARLVGPAHCGKAIRRRSKYPFGDFGVFDFRSIRQ
jgi:hypothetical protein